MNRPLLYAALSIALLALGCGGSSTGSGAGSTNTGSNVSLTTPTVEAILVPGDPTVSYDTANPVPQDSLNIQSGQVVQFQTVGYDAKGGRHVLNAQPWRDSDPNSQYGLLDNLTGRLATTNVPTAAPQTIGALYNGIEYTTTFQLKVPEAVLIGRVVSSYDGSALRNIGILFFASDGTQVGSVTTGYDGTFRASVPTTVASFTVDPATVGSGYWQSFDWFGQVFDAGVNTCYASFSSTNPNTGAIWTFYNRSAQATQTAAVTGENFFFAPAQPSTLFTAVRPQTSTDPGLITLNARTNPDGSPAGKPIAGCD